MKRAWVWVLFLIVALIALFVATRSEAVGDLYEPCGIVGAPNCIPGITPGTWTCTDPCNGVYQQYQGQSPCILGSCFVVVWEWVEPPGEMVEIHIPIGCPYTSCHSEGGELEKPSPRQSTWSEVRQLYRSMMREPSGRKD